MDSYINITQGNIASEHLCCGIADKKHQPGVDGKRAWLGDRLPDGHVFRRLDARGKVFIEYAPLESAWVPVEGDNYLYIYCLWVSGSFKGHGHARDLLQSCIDDAKARGKSGVCVLSSGKKKPFLSDKKFMLKFGFTVADTALGGYELLALSFDGTVPHFTKGAKTGRIDNPDLTVFYSRQCPYTADCATQIENYCTLHSIPLTLIAVESLKQAKEIPGVFNNRAVFYRGEFQTVHLLNENHLKKLLEK